MKKKKKTDEDAESKDTEVKDAEKRDASQKKKREAPQLAEVKVKTDSLSDAESDFLGAAAGEDAKVAVDQEKEDAEVEEEFEDYCPFKLNMGRDAQPEEEMPDDIVS